MVNDPWVGLDWLPVFPWSASEPRLQPHNASNAIVEARARVIRRGPGIVIGSAIARSVLLEKPELRWVGRFLRTRRLYELVTAFAEPAPPG